MEPPLVFLLLSGKFRHSGGPVNFFGLFFKGWLAARRQKMLTD
jgi:hypothetical protein